jgi:dephospho-CoA kinase
LHSEIERRIANQVSPDERKAVANFVIENDGTEDELLRKVENIWEELNASSH